MALDTTAARAAGGATAEEAGRLVVLEPDSGIQFLDFVIEGEAAAAVSRRFFEDDGDATDATPALHAVTLDGDGYFLHPVTQEPADPGLAYAIDGARALAAFAGKWLPVPVLREARQGGGLAGGGVDEGPTNWARLLVERDVSRADAVAFHAVLAIDTTLLREVAGARAVYAAPLPEDAQEGALFRLCDDEAEIAGFVSEAWVDDWLGEAFRARPDQGSRSPEGPRLAHLSHYLTLLGAVRAVCPLPRIMLGGGDRHASTVPIPVDLALDIGATRTTALLSEAPPDGHATGPLLIAPLPLRDLGAPWRTYSGTFPSRLEMARAVFGNEALSRWSGRNDAFQWPSLVRVGAEAMRLAAGQPTPDAATGLSSTGVSSPLPYVWDERPSRHIWRFASDSNGRKGTMVTGPLLAHLDEAGNVLAPGDKRMATKPRFSRSALLTLYVAELLQQAIAAVNSPAYRTTAGHPGTARRLARLLITLPTALHEHEQAIVRRRIEAAVALVWQAMGWSGGLTGGKGVPRRPPPTVLFVQDNASNAQITWLWNEVAVKFRGNARDYLDLMGKLRPGHGAARSLRVASLDIGGGGTGIAVATYELVEPAAVISSRQLLDGFRVGADDLLRAIAEAHILPALEQRLTECKSPDARRFLESVLAESGDKRSARAAGLGSRLAAELLMPAALGLLREHLATRGPAADLPLERTLAALLADDGIAVAPTGTAAGDFDTLAADDGAEGFSPLEVDITCLHGDIAATIDRVLGPILAAARRAIHALDCDVVLLTGWLAQAPRVLDTLLAAMPTRPDRIVALHRYRVGPWLDGRLPSGALVEPRTFAAIGALLAGQPQPRLGTLTLVIRPPELALRRAHLGRMCAKGMLRNDAVMFRTGEAGPGKAAVTQRPVYTIETELPLTIGMRRQAFESWPATPLYVLDFDPRRKGKPPKSPLRIALEHGPASNGQPEGLRVQWARDADGHLLGEDEVALSLRTLGGNGRWLDTGALTLARPEGDDHGAL